MVRWWDHIDTSDVARQLLVVGFHSTAYVVLFWTAVVAGEFTVDRLALVPWVYGLVVSFRMTYRLDAIVAPEATIGQFLRNSVQWVFVFPVAILVGNVLVTMGLAMAIRDPGLDGVPIVRTFAEQWTALYVSGLSALILYASVICAVAAGLGILVRIGQRATADWLRPGQ
ncbi:hypothetical protein [Haloarchaeobius sp. TZWSO28]|uniref:hypothetical protein n=1 Tax=Haloarchaeobius sp. TZWSO28 TaxID=3446119 RepID=UPI003EBFD889